eukprot:354869-Chlamydomonas_euryale.AAC.8
MGDFLALLMLYMALPDVCLHGMLHVLNTSSKQHAARNMHYAACSMQFVARGMQYAASNTRHAAHRKHGACSMQHTPYSMQCAARSMQQATYRMQHATCSTQRAARSKHMTSSAGVMQPCMRACLTRCDGQEWLVDLVNVHIINLRHHTQQRLWQQPPVNQVWRLQQRLGRHRARPQDRPADGMRSQKLPEGRHEGRNAAAAAAAAAAAGIAAASQGCGARRAAAAHHQPAPRDDAFPMRCGLYTRAYVQNTQARDFSGQHMRECDAATDVGGGITQGHTSMGAPSTANQTSDRPYLRLAPPRLRASEHASR